MEARGTLFVVSAPSGAGKTTLVRALINEDQNLKVSVSHTTKPIREQDVEGRDYFFVSELDFQKMVDEGEFLEHVNIFGHWYGTSYAWIEEQISLGFDIVLELDWEGAKAVKKKFSDSVNVIILPLSKEILEERVIERDRDPKDVIEYRLSKLKDEVANYKEYDYIVVNDDFNSALDDLHAIVRSRRLKLSYQESEIEEIIEDLVN